MHKEKQLTDREKARIARNAYMKEWRRKNPEKIRAYNEKHFVKKYDEMTNPGTATTKGGDSE